MPSLKHGEFKIKSFIDGTLYRARVQRSDGAQFMAYGKPTNMWESSQSIDPVSAIGQAVYAIDTGKIKIAARAP
ncbi:MAG TPA: hypothetical protein VKB67_13935 [Rhizomicrobium sp.]|nr:hypothetical protein [Rhizomicrobium sp.]